MISPQHVMILASAGSGKTYALTSRYVALLAAGAPPSRIVALTFTRKAAGEFFDGILQKLASAALDDDEARELARDIERPELARADFLRLLRAVADELHRLRLGTFDGFFARIARTFPFELGLTGDFEILHAHAANLERRRVLQLLFAPDGELADAQREFLEAFKRATFGTEEKQLGMRLDAFLDEHFETYLEAPAAEAWGNAARIWPAGRPWRSTGKLAPAIAEMRAWLTRAAPEPKQRGRWENFLVELESWSPGAPIGKALEYILKKALESWSELTACAADLMFDRKKQSLDAPACRAMRDIVCSVAGGELERRLATTQGIHAVLRTYDDIYDAVVRRAGRLTFGDVERMLRPEGERVLSRRGEGGERLFLDYRLDAEIDHWLLDEFQDTSHGQWSVLRNLIDEVVQDFGGNRSFFCVGDVKQAIFTWRAGDPRLMGEILAQYNGGAAGPITTKPLDASWRSGPAIVEMVNRVFGAAEVIAGLFPGRASEAWNAAWRAHTTARSKRNGQAALLHAVDEAERQKLTLDLLREIQPLALGLTCAVLVRRNSEAAAMADFLRREGGLPAVAESDLCVCTDNPLGAAMLALVQAAAHPGDSLAWEHVQMTPLGTVLAEEGIATRDALSWRLLGDIQAHGFERATEYWLERLLGRLETDHAFTRERARQFAAAAALFDATGSRDGDEFIAFMGRHVVREPESASVVRVMTIHKSKGLGFDVVIVPELQGNRINEARDGLAVQRNAEREVEWVLELPPALIAREDEVLKDYIERAEDDACYESLSLLYVALTRAKHALYVITEPAEKSSSLNFPKLLGETLGHASGSVRVGGLTLAGAWSAGDADWHREVAPPPVPEPQAKFAVEEFAPVQRRVARRASAGRRAEGTAGQLFALGGADSAAFGTLVHRLLAQVEWGDAADVAELVKGWREAGVDPEVVAHVRAALSAAELAPVWRRSAIGSVELWRERAFEVVLGDAWVTGVFDRVMVLRDAAGAAVGATVFDFKTDRVAPDASAAVVQTVAARHATQLGLYRDVAARLTGLPRERVGAELVFTGAGRRVSLGSV